MGTLRTSDPNSRELVTEILDEGGWWGILKLVVNFLRSKGVEEVQIEFGFVLDRDLKGESQGQRRTVRLVDLESAIKRGLDEGAIEWAGSSDFFFTPLGTDLAFMLCNDADLHFASHDAPLLMELGHQIRVSGIRVYGSGKLV